MKRKPYPPGQSGIKRRSRFPEGPDFKKQLMEKQRFRFQYNVSESQMKQYFKEASKQTGNTVDNIVQLLESRLDAVMYRSGFAPSIFASRQFTSHGHFLVNGKDMNIPSYRMRENDVLMIRPKSRNLAIFSDIKAPSTTVPYLLVEVDKMKVTFLHFPLREDVPIIRDVPLVIEYFSRF